MKEFNLEAYLTNGVEKIVKGILKASAKNPAASLYMLQYTKVNKQANKSRKEAEEKGEHIPPFLIASITTQCNLHCAGCYARANNSCSDHENATAPKQLSAEQWKDIFRQAAQLGISFILLAGGEPMLRNDVLLAAGSQKKILFPIFTNGTMITEANINMFSAHPNLLPVFSIEGNQLITDERRGKGVFDKLLDTFKMLHKKGIVFGTSVTVQKNNMQEVMDTEFLDLLKENGCKAVVYVEYVPVDKETASLAPEEQDRIWMMEKLLELREQYEDLLFVAFPGDEKTSGGCLAAGRGFFHINAYGGAEPCPFSAYSDTSLNEVSLKEALQSPLFLSLQRDGTLLAEHTGGCVLFEQEERVKEILAK